MPTSLVERMIDSGSRRPTLCAPAWFERDDAGEAKPPAPGEGRVESSAQFDVWRAPGCPVCPFARLACLPGMPGCPVEPVCPAARFGCGLVLWDARACHERTMPRFTAPLMFYGVGIFPGLVET